MTDHPKTALLAVDVQNDFVGGSLGGEGRIDVVRPLVLLAESDEVDVVIASRDWHPNDHCSFAENPEFRDGSWPAHCVQGTPGAELIPAVEQIADAIVDKGTDSNVEAYSAFEGDVRFGPLGTKLDKFLRDLGVTRVIVGGLCTDYCVKATALDAQALGYETWLAPEASAGVAEATTTEALVAMAYAGVGVWVAGDARERVRAAHANADEYEAEEA